MKKLLQNITLSFEQREKFLRHFLFSLLIYQKNRRNQNFVWEKCDLVGGGIGTWWGGIQKILVGGGGIPPIPPTRENPEGICRLFPPFAKMNVTKINILISLFRDVVHSKVNTGERESLSGIFQSETLSTIL